jgi:translation initiation factor IF-2
MRLVQVAKVLGMTGQQLRKELEQVDFGVKPTDREIPDNLAHGVVRFIARKHNIQLPPDVMAALLGESPEEADKPAEAKAAAVMPERTPEEVANADALHVLRKLTLDDVSKEAIKRHTPPPKPVLSKEEREEKEREDRAKARGINRRGQGASGSATQEQIKKKEGPVTLPALISVKEFAEKTGVQVPKVIQALMKNGMMVTITQNIDYDTAAIIAADLGVVVERGQASASVEQLHSKNLEELLKDDEKTEPRPPIVVVMGHVDHGKTSLLDAIRQSDVVSTESGGITQHIGAYQVTHAGKPITFLDTPGHEAFTAMRARGAQVTDVAILVVSAEEGVKETTIEAINHAKEAGVPIIVAVNKMDRPNADPDRVKGELAAHGLQPEEWGGTTPMVPTSAVTKMGIDVLLDHVLLLAELEELKANPKRPAIATIIESHLDPALGPLASVVINTGTLKVGDAFVCGRTVGRVRAMVDAAGKRVESVPPSGAVRVSGFDETSQVGDILQVVASEREARHMRDALLEKAGEQQQYGFADLVSRLHEGKLQQLKVVLKADTHGSLEAIQATLGKQATNEVQVKVIHGAIGAVTESDVMMASASEALVMAFRVDVPGAVVRTADREGVQIREYDIIYKLFEEIGDLMKGLLIPEEEEKILGHLEVKGVFLTKKTEQVIGGKVSDGVVKRLTFRLQRAGENIGNGRITSLRKVDKDIKEAKEGTECGMRVEASVPVEVGDVLEVFSKEFKKKEE